MMRLRLLLGCTAAVFAGCSSFTHFNHPLERPREGFAFHREIPLGVGETATDVETDSPPMEKVRATFAVDGKRGNQDVLFFLALSGGGSRAGYFSAATMLALQSAFEDHDLLREVDVISAVSGGTLPAAYYAISRDEAVTLEDSVKRLVRRHDGAGQNKDPGRYRRWSSKEVRELMSRNYVARWIGNWFWPHNLLGYWFTAYDRSDIMAKTFEDNFLDTPFFGTAYTFGDMNPERPYLIINATNATEQRKKGPLPDEFAFGSVFSFTSEDFETRLNSDIATFSLARAVTASSAFPLVFPSVSLRDFRSDPPDCKDGPANLFLDDKKAPGPFTTDDKCDPRYVHVFDGGNSDNLGLKSVKRALFELETKRQLKKDTKIVVLLVDAYAKPSGQRRSDYDPRTLIGRILDPNLLEAVDSLLQANRNHLINEFRARTLGWDTDCADGSRTLPRRLCDDLDALPGEEPSLKLNDRMFFYHLGFENLEDPRLLFRVEGHDSGGSYPDLKARLDRISTSFSIAEDEASALAVAADAIVTRHNPCLATLRKIVRGEAVSFQGLPTACAPMAKKEQAARPVRQASTVHPAR